MCSPCNGSEALTKPKRSFTHFKGIFGSRNQPSVIQGDPSAHPAHHCPSAEPASSRHVPGLLSNQIINNINSSGDETCLSWCQIMFSLYQPTASPERSQQIEQDPPHGAGSARLGFRTAGTSRQSRPGTPAQRLSFARGRGEKPKQGCAAGAKSPPRNQGWQLPASCGGKEIPLVPRYRHMNPRFLHRVLGEWIHPLPKQAASSGNAPHYPQKS